MSIHVDTNMSPEEMFPHADTAVGADPPRRVIIIPVSGDPYETTLCLRLSDQYLAVIGSVYHV